MANENSYIGKQIGSYRLIAEVAQGGFGSVYRAQHVFLMNRIVAVKVMHTAHLGSQEEREHFLEEARFLELLKHPNILTIIDVGIDGGIPFLISEYAANGSLRDRLKHQFSSPLLIDESLTILSQIGQALHYAHLQNIIHRDLKPENILFSANGEALLADFGIATMLATTSINYGTAIGTPRYMAPEQFRGSVSKETDQYALGCIAYELFTGKPAFDALNPAALMYQHLMEYPIAPSQLNAQIPRHIEQAIFKAMAKQRTDRHYDILAFISALCSPSIPHAPLSSETIDERPIDPALATVLSKTLHQDEKSSEASQNALDISPDDSTQIVEKTLRRSLLPLTGNMVTLIPESMTSSDNTIREQEQVDFSQNIVLRQTRSEAAQTHPLNHEEPFAPASVANSISAQGTVLYPVSSMNSNHSGHRQSGPRDSKRRWFITTGLLVLLLLFISSSILYASSHLSHLPTHPSLVPTSTALTGSESSATVKLTAARKDFKKTYSIFAVTGIPDVSQHQVAARILSSDMPSQSQTVQSTGRGTTAATYAKGSLDFSGFGGSTTIIPAGSIFTDAKGIQVATDAAMDLSMGSGSVSAHAVQAGISGNIPVNDINQTSQTGEYDVSNGSAFTGGQDAQTSAYIQQSDINNAASPLETSLLQNAQTSLQSQIKPNEKLINTPQCSTKVITNHAAGDKATSVTVTVTATCIGEVYDQQAAQAMAANLLKNDAVSNNYNITGRMITTVVQAKVVDSKSTVGLLVTAEGTEVYQFSDTQKQHLAQMIAGKTEQDAQTLLLQQTGVSNAQIQLPVGDKILLPKDPGKIMMLVN